jgi:uroporphyrinogen decarboxylase
MRTEGTMTTLTPFSVTITPNWQELVAVIRRERMPARVHFIELFLDAEVQTDICRRFNLQEGLDPSDPFFDLRLQVKLQQFLGYDYVTCGLENMEMPTAGLLIEDTADLKRSGGRNYLDEHRGPITSWEEFKHYPWPDPAKADTRKLDWYSEHLPEGMCILSTGLFGHFAEYLNWLMGYETLCYALFDQRDLVQAIADKIMELSIATLKRTLQFERVKIVWGSDDMGFRSSTLISPADLREFVLPGHKLMAQMCHAAGRPYILHSCGNLSTILPDLIDDVQIDARHSFEDVIQPVTAAKQQYGDRIALLGGIDLDFLCRASEPQVRARVRETLAQCMPGSGYCLGTGNSVANYIQLENYLAMLDEGRRFNLQELKS